MTDQSNCAVDTSVAVPLLVASHVAHRAVSSWAANRSLVLCGHALAETYSVLTRLPGDARLAPADAALLIDENFIVNLPPSPEAASTAHRSFASLGITGGAIYDGLVAMAAREHDLVLATRDARAMPTYEAVGVQVEVVV